MSGTSLDGIDVALVSEDNSQIRLKDTYFLAYPNALKDKLLSLHTPCHQELEISALTANTLAKMYAQAVQAILEKNKLDVTAIAAIGNHGQTIRHCPKLHDGVGYTLQIGNNSLLAELTGITVVADFRSRDIAAGGQGAPLVPAFHQAVFGSSSCNRAIINIGGIANITYLPANGKVLGFDSGPGNMLIDYWTKLNTGQDYDTDGKWASSGVINTSLLEQMLAEPYFLQAPPKSTGRDLFNSEWISQHFENNDTKPEDVARTLTQLTAVTIQQAINRFCQDVDEVYLCGGGAHNQQLCTTLSELLSSVTIAKTDALGIDADWVEATAFAWLAKQTLENKPANLPAVTGARGLRVLGAIYPA
jgi:anhydro-N-acetylmuramic acid kinase